MEEQKAKIELKAVEESASTASGNAAPVLQTSAPAAAAPPSPPLQPAAKSNDPDSTSPDYVFDYLVLRLEQALAGAQKLKMHGEADIASRLMLLLSERKVAAAQAEETVKSIEAALHRHQSRRLTTVGLAVMLATLIVLFFGWPFVKSTLLTPPTPVYDPHSPVAFHMSPNDWEDVPVSMEGKVHSKTWSARATYVLSNHSKDSIRAYWLDYAGRRVLYFVLDPGDTHTETTFVSHPWLFTNSLNQPLKLVIPTDSTRQTIDITSK